MPRVSSQFIFTDVDTEVVKGEMPLLRSWSRCRNWEQVFSLILSPFKQDKAMNFGQGLPDVFSGANKAEIALLDSFCFHCAAFWDSKRKAKNKDSPTGTKRTITCIWKIQPWAKCCRAYWSLLSLIPGRTQDPMQYMGALGMGHIQHAPKYSNGQIWGEKNFAFSASQQQQFAISQVWSFTLISSNLERVSQGEKCLGRRITPLAQMG